MITMVDHLVSHSTVDTDVFASDEACLIRTEEKHHVGDVHRIAHTTCRLLKGIWTVVFLKISVNPSRRD